MSLAATARNLIVTPGGKRMRTLTLETWKKLIRLMRDSKHEGLVARFSCAECREPVTLVNPNPISPRLECGCTQWIGR